MRHTRRILFAVFLLALGVRVAYVLTSESNALGESSRNADIAHNIVDGGRWFYLNEPAMIRMSQLVALHHRLIEPEDVDLTALNRGVKLFPDVAEPVGTAAVLAGVWALVGGERYLPMQLLQAIVDALAALLVYRIAMLLFRRPRAALIAAVAYAVYLPIAWEAIVVNDDFWAVDFTLVIVASYLEALNSAAHRRRWLLACGLCTGLGAYFHPTVLIIPVAIALVNIAQAGWRAALGWGLSVSAIAALLLVPWTIRNYEDFHRFIPTRSAFWENVWNGLGETHNDFGATEDLRGEMRAETARERPELRFESPAWDSFIKARVVKALEAHPLYYLELLARRTALATVVSYAPEWMRRGSVLPFSDRDGPLAFIAERPLDLLEYAFQPGVFLLAMLALIKTWRRWRREHAILIAVVLSALVPYILIHLESRYILPADFAYCIWIGLGVDLLCLRIQEIRSRPALYSHRPSTWHTPV